MRTFLILLLVSLFLVPLKSEAAEDEPLITKVIEHVSPPVFGLNDPRAKFSREIPLSEADQARTLPLADHPNGGKRYDVLKWLTESGITERPGQVAVYMPNEPRNTITFAA